MARRCYVTGLSSVWSGPSYDNFISFCVRYNTFPSKCAIVMTNFLGLDDPIKLTHNPTISLVISVLEISPINSNR